jgi:hypothetical protein
MCTVVLQDHLPKDPLTCFLFHRSSRGIMYRENHLKALGIGHIVRDLAGAVVVFLEFLIEADDNL